MSTPAEWKSQLNKWGDKLVLVVEDISVEVVKTVRERIAERTPKLTGRAAGSWNASVGTPNYSYQPETFNDVSGSVDAGQVNLENFKLGDRAYVSNGIPYISDLNNGSSRKAPAGFVEASVQEVHSYLPEVVRRVKGRHRL